MYGFLSGLLLLQSLDQSEVGIGALMKQLDSFLKEKDLQLWDNLAAKKLVPQFYSFRWLTLLLSQEFQLPGTLSAHLVGAYCFAEVIRLWDSFFADPRRFEFMIHFCGAMLMYVPVSPSRFALANSSHVDLCASSSWRASSVTT